jgi:hypothetical protein
MDTRVSSVLADILNRFKKGDIPECVALSMYPVPEIPAKNWSFLNRTIMIMRGTSDARGFRQWEQAGRKVKKGAKAFYILAPLIFKNKKSEELLVKGFKPVPVFRLEDTEGEPLDYQQIELPELPLMEKARAWGVNIKPIAGNNRHFGYFSAKTQEIALATEEECVFFHELCHCAEARLWKVAPGQNALEEVSAELGAAALCRIVGKSGDKYLGNNYRYIETYADDWGYSPIYACMKVMKNVEAILNHILE